MVKRGVWTLLPDVRTELDAWAHYYARTQQDGAERQLDPILDGAYAQHKAAPRDRPLAKNTLEQYDAALEKLKHLFRKFSNPEQVKQKDAAQVKVLLAKTPNWANRCISLGRSLFGILVENQVVDTNPFLGVKRHREKKRTRLLTWEEWHKIRAAGSRRLQLVMDGLYLTDRRVSEQLLNLDERDALEQGVYFPSTKTDKELIIRWNEDLRRWWDECLALHRRGNVVALPSNPKAGGDRPRPLFRTRHGRRPAYGTVRDEWDRACAKAGVEDAHLHDNRAFSATEMKRQAGGGEAGEAAAQALLGHRERGTTRIYLRDREIEIVDGPTMRRLA